MIIWSIWHSHHITSPYPSSLHIFVTRRNIALQQICHTAETGVIYNVIWQQCHVLDEVKHDNIMHKSDKSHKCWVFSQLFSSAAICPFSTCLLQLKIAIFPNDCFFSKANLNSEVILNLITTTVKHITNVQWGIRSRHLC